MLRILLLSLITLNVVGCGHQPLANKMTWFGTYWDAQDPCNTSYQHVDGTKFRDENYRAPVSMCGGNTRRTVIYSNTGQPMGYIKQ